MRQDSLRSRQFVGGLKEIAETYDQFLIDREIEDLDKAESLLEELNNAYKMQLGFEDALEFGRACLRRQALPQN